MYVINNKKRKSGLNPILYDLCNLTMSGPQPPEICSFLCVSMLIRGKTSHCNVLAQMYKVRAEMRATVSWFHSVRCSF